MSSQHSLSPVNESGGRSDMTNGLQPTENGNGTTHSSKSEPEKRRKRAGWDEGPDEKRVRLDSNGVRAGSSSVSPRIGVSPGSTTPTGTSLLGVRHVPLGGLTADQRARLEKAKMFAREQTAKLMAAKLGTAAPALLTPGAVAAGLEARSLAVMSRIYVGSINFELTEVHIKQVFGQFGYVKAISMTIDPLTQKHKGFCFVEYEVPEAAQLALDNMNGAQLGGRQLKVGRPNNFNSNAATFPSAPPTRLYIANVNEFVTEDNIASIFEAFGNIKGCVLMPDPLTRKHKTAGYVEFEEESGADGAIRAMNGFELGGMHLRVMKAIVGGPLPEGMKSLEKMAPGAPIAAIPAKALNTAMSINNTIARKIGTTPSIASSLPISAMLAKAQEKANEETTSLEDNVSISASQRYSIMQKLLRSKEQSPVIALKNMIKLKESHDQELYEEIADECRKFGDVVKIGTDGSGAEDPEEHVVLFVQFGSAEAAERAKMGLHGRFFGGQLVEASFSSLEEFRKKF